MSEKQGILKRLEYYADCIDKGIHVTGSQLKRLVLDIRERGLVSSQQPAAVDEAMELLDEAYGELAADSYRDGPRSLLLTRMEAALAAQQGDGTDE